MAINMLQQKKANHRRCRKLQTQTQFSNKSVLLILSLFIAVGRGDGDCDLKCTNGSRCVAGSATFDNHPKEDDGSDLPFHNDQLSQNNFHCECNPGFTGLTCAIIYESCADASDFHNCYHGAPCVPTGEDEFGNTQYFCDCSATNSEGGVYYTGEYCQNEHSTAITSCDPIAGFSCQNGGLCLFDENGDWFCECEDRFHGNLCELDGGVSCGDTACYNGSPCVETDEGEAYCDCSQTTVPDKRFMGASCDQELSVKCDESKICLNAGKCVENDNGSFSCDCTDEWRGPSCEYASFDHEIATTESCDLECRNGGTCGRSPIDSSDESLGVEDRCVCPTGWIGAKCEYKYEECGKGEHICLHGSKCVQLTGRDEKWTCECEKEYREDQNYEREFCQHHKMTVCSTADAALQMYDGPVSALYCVNDATCVEIEENGRIIPACQCPDGYRGPHCEFLGPPIIIIEEPFGLGIVASAATVFGFLLMVVAIGACLGFIVLQRKAIERVIVELPKSPKFLDNPIRALGNWNDEVGSSFDLQSLEDVELI